MELDPLAARRRRLRRRSGAVVLILGLGALAVLRTDAGRQHAPAWLRGTPSSAGGSGAVTRVVPVGTRIKVEVLNASDSRGAARAAAALLRDAGFDVVYFGNTSERADSTVVRDRSGHPAWADLAKEVMAPARVESRADSTRLLDLSVVIGSLWRPPTEPLRP